MVTYPRCMTSTAKTSPGYIISKSIEMFRVFTVTQHLYLHLVWLLLSAVSLHCDFLAFWLISGIYHALHQLIT